MEKTKCEIRFGNTHLYHVSSDTEFIGYFCNRCIADRVKNRKIVAGETQEEKDRLEAMYRDRVAFAPYLSCPEEV